MISEYPSAAMRRASYEILDDPEPFYAEIPGIHGVWATGKTLQECRQSLLEAWIV